MVDDAYILKVRVGKRFTIALPKEVIEKLGIKEGDELRLIISRDVIVSKKVVSLIDFIERVEPKGSINDFLKVREEEVSAEKKRQDELAITSKWFS